MKGKIWIIEEAETDSMENHASDAFYYVPRGYVTSREEAVDIVREGGPGPECWANTGRLQPKYRFRELAPFTPDPEP